MNYTSEIEINLPIDRVIELFDNPDYLKEWQPGFQSMEHISGEPGKPGAKTKLKYKMGKREVEMIETIIERNFPEEFTATYETKGVYNKIVNRFKKIDENKTKYITEQEFQFSGFMKLLGWFMPGAFKKESQKYLQQFKDFAENKEKEE